MVILGLIMFVIFFSPTIGYSIWFIVKKAGWDKTKQKLLKAGGVGVLVLNTMVVTYFQIKSKEAANERQAQSDAENLKLQTEYTNEAATVAKTLLSLLRESGVDKSLVIKVEPNGYRRVGIFVTNTWLARPEYEQKQMKKIIEMSLKNIRPPEGYPFTILDYLGSEI